MDIPDINPRAIGSAASGWNLGGHLDERAARRREVSSACQARTVCRKDNNHEMKPGDNGGEHIGERRNFHMWVRLVMGNDKCDDR